MSKRPTAAVLMCDCVSWRLDLFRQALERIGDATWRRDLLADVRLGYRLRDDLAFLIVEQKLLEDPAFPSLAASDADLPGLRAMEIPREDVEISALRDRLLSSCDAVTDGLDPQTTIARIRAVLGMRDDRRTALRLSVDAPVRYRSGETWYEASTRDLSSHGIFVHTSVKVPPVGETVQVELFRGSAYVIHVPAQVVRHAPGGFGARLSLNTAAQNAMYGYVRSLRLPLFAAAAGTDVRIPAHFDVSFRIGKEVVREKLENLSRGGAFVRSKRIPPKGTPIELEIQVPDAGSVRLAADVMRVVNQDGTDSPAGFGVSFREVSQDDQTKLDKCIMEAVTQPFARVMLALASQARVQAAATVLAEKDCDVIGAMTEREALDRLMDELLGLDLLVVDHDMPGSGSAELLNRIRRLGGEMDLPVAVVFDGPKPEAQKLLAAGATAVFSWTNPRDVAARCVELISMGRAAAAAQTEEMLKPTPKASGPASMRSISAGAAQPRSPRT
jgi:DNA-binding NarL/FixJ family response regulator